ncbi:DUF1778 domain-containing protein [Moraxella sp. FZFQ2102]|uniref:type II toxin-antitoxin system TacA family antitoxin n=1 Tax=Moraxella sp. FZFQ2102 TaxID=2953752 RepID=UPI00209BECC9|nr:DUF1778 domain-containing protein [Moraxella sp. FZFQ2102]USZ14102.1 DUF1778 domain-containing protein [Moraxella sp. FZFQ2102]
MRSSARINIRTTPHAKSTVEQACSMMGVSISHFMMTLAYEKSLELINSQLYWDPSDADKALMQDLMENPREPTPALQELMHTNLGVKDLT